MSSTSTEATFFEQCHSLCLNFLKIYIFDHMSDFDKDDLKQLDENVKQEIESLDYESQDITAAALHLSRICSSFEISQIGRVANSVKMIWHGDLSETNFNEAADSLLENDAVASWEEVSLILLLMYRTMKVRDISELLDLVRLTTNHLTISAEDFVTQFGWQSAKPEEEQVEESNEEISSSIVVVPTQQTADQTETTPPLSLPPSTGDDEESLNSATPPEMVDRPPMTSSLMQMMASGDVGSLNENAASSEGTDFEMVGSINTTPASYPSSPKEVADETANEPIINKQTLTSQLESFSADDEDQSANDDAPQEGATISDYLPQISLGVAAAAACIGFLVLKKATA